ncbi:MAG TPA: hypothetical protein VKA84_18025, partial [Gemmatimonadaceae bacterium]|nr:hypothetical protein [Gemmatimonadaceae bacterium]
MHAVSLLLFALLVVGYLAFGVEAVPRRLRAALPTPAARALAGPLVLAATCALYAGARGLSVAPRAAAYAALAL